MNTLESFNAFDSRPNTNLPLSIYRPARTVYANRILTLENAEKGIVLRVGEEFTLNLGEASWNVRVCDARILTSADGRNFQATETGKTRVYATSEPPRDDSSPLAKPRKLFLEFPVTVLE